MQYSIYIYRSLLFSRRIPEPLCLSVLLGIQLRFQTHAKHNRCRRAWYYIVYDMCSKFTFFPHLFTNLSCADIVDRVIKHFLFDLVAHITPIGNIHNVWHRKYSKLSCERY